MEGANTAKLAGTRRQVLAAQRQQHVGQQQQYDSDLQVCLQHSSFSLYPETIEHVKNGCMYYKCCCFFTASSLLACSEKKSAEH